MKTILVFGATSVMIRETLRRFAMEGWSFVLVGRSANRLAAAAGDLKARNAAAVKWFVHDLQDYESQSSLWEKILSAEPHFEHILFAFGELPDQRRAEADVEYERSYYFSHVLNSISWLNRIAHQLERQKNGTLSVIASVAGDLGRRSNYVYGTSKASLSTYLQGLRGRLHMSGVRVLTIKPGFVDTPMTETQESRPLASSAEIVGKAIFQRMTRSTSEIAYVPARWQLVMSVLKLIPEAIFKRLPL